jgi:hypothetical protein
MPKSLLIYCLIVGLFLIALFLFLSNATPTSPPFHGTIFIDPDILTAADPTAFTGLTYAGRSLRRMFDRRIDDSSWNIPYLFDAQYDDGLAIEIQVNREFGSVEAAQAEAEKYAPVIGRLPTALREHVETVWIHQGEKLFGGGNDNILIHIGQAALYERDGILEEALIHEASHTSLDADHAQAHRWLTAQKADPTFISDYARDHPRREDVAESFLPYLAVRHRAGRISNRLARKIEATMPHRIKYFDAQEFDLYPLVPHAEDSSGPVPSTERARER